MERINLNYCLKNIPIPTKSAYCLKLIDKIESVIKRMRWKAFFFLTCNSSNANSNNCDNMKETFGFKSKNHPAQINELKNFEKELLDIIPSIKFRDIRDKFQTKMKNDISKIKSSPNIFYLQIRPQACTKCHLIIIKSYYMKILPKRTKSQLAVWRIQ